MNFRILLLLPLLVIADRGDLISYTKKAEVSSDEQRSLCTAFSISCTQPKTSQVYTFTYNTIGLNGSEAIASGVVVIPKNAQKNHLLTYLHGTVSNKEGAPSNLGYHMQLPLAVFTQGNFTLVIPDYLGIGQSSILTHPFCHASSLASASYDAIKAAKALLNQLNSPITNNLYLTGYSEGGMATLALHQYLENNPIEKLNFVGSCPMSGPYDLSASIPFAFTSKSSRMNTYISFMITSYNSIYPMIFPPFETIFSQEINYMIPLLFDGCHPFWEINTILNRVPNLLRPEFIQTLQHPHSVFLAKLKENDTYNFVPKQPIHFIGLEKDTEVGYLNSVRAYNWMKDRKAPVSLESASSDLDHMQGSPLCHIKALEHLQRM